MRNWKHCTPFAVLFVAVSLALFGCGGGGGSGEPQSAAKTVSGVVADGYLVGATVFLDRNGNKVLDLDEPSTTTGSGGAYTLTAADIDLYPLVVIVGVEVVDEDTGAAVGQEYVLAAPPGKPEFISPITTIIQERLEANPSLDLGEAEDLVKRKLGVTDDVDLFEDYIEPDTEGLSPGEAVVLREKLQTVHKVAQVVARTFGEMQGKIEAAAESAGVDLSDDLDAIVAMVVDRVIEKLGQIYEAVQGVEDVETISDDTVAEIEQEDPVTADNVAEEVERAKTVPQASAWSAILADGGVYWFDFDERCDGGAGCSTEIHYGQVQPQSDGSIEEEHGWFDFVTDQWVSETGSDMDSRYVLLQGQWTLVQDGPSEFQFQMNADGSAVLSHPQLGQEEKIEVVAADLAGKKMSAFLDPDAKGLFVDPAATFPSGAKAYKMTFTALQDRYEVGQWMDDVSGKDHNFASYWDCPTTGGACTESQVADLAEFLDVFAAVDGNDNQFRLGKLALQFAADGSIDIYREFQTWDGTQMQYGSELLTEAGALREQVVDGQTLHFLDLPGAYAGLLDWGGEEPTALFLVVLDGGVKVGTYSAAGTVTTEGGVNLNLAAFNAVKNNLALGEAPPVTTLPFTLDLVSGKVFVFQDAGSADVELIWFHGDGSLEVRGWEYDSSLQQDVAYEGAGTWSLAEDGVLTGTMADGSATLELLEDGASALTLRITDAGGPSFTEVWHKTVPFVAADLIGNSYGLSEGQVLTFADATTGSIVDPVEGTDGFTWSVGSDGAIAVDLASGRTPTLYLLAGGTASQFGIAGYMLDGSAALVDVFAEELTKQ